MAADKVLIRSENTGDRQERSLIRSINDAAFGGQDEGKLVDNLRNSGEALVSLVAELEAGIVGHILFSRLWIERARDKLPAVALAPMAVLPDYQRRGIGGRLIRQGLELLRERGEEIVIVVGHAAYYPRFGFSRELARVLESPFPAEVFMAMELRPGALEFIRGKVRYPTAFGL